MMCHRTGFPPISIIGLGFRCDSSLMRVPNPPARITAFMSGVRRTGSIVCGLIGYLRVVESVPGRVYSNGLLLQSEDGGGNSALENPAALLCPMARRKRLSAALDHRGVICCQSGAWGATQSSRRTSIAPKSAWTSLSFATMASSRTSE
jgi:hypothetical protein